jgi:hypothetical protein
MLLAYRNMPYGCGPWTARETAAIKNSLHGSINALFTAVPSRSHASCKRKRKELIAEADDEARSNPASGQERRRYTRQRLVTFAPPKPKPSSSTSRSGKRERSKRQHHHCQHSKRKGRKGQGRGGGVCGEGSSSAVSAHLRVGGCSLQYPILSEGGRMGGRAYHSL